MKEKIISIYPDFPKNILKIHPDLTSAELEFCLYIKYNMSDLELAKTLRLKKKTIDSKRYRLKKKLGLSREERLNNYIVRI